MSRSLPRFALPFVALSLLAACGDSPETLLGKAQDSLAREDFDQARVEVASALQEDPGNAAMLEVLGEDYIRTARAKGLNEGEVIWRHAIRPALLPVMSYLGPAIAGIITGSVVIEQIFGIPGIGRYFVQGALNRDYTLVMGTVVFYGVLIVLMNLIVDLLYSALDPQIRYDD